MRRKIKWAILVLAALIFLGVSSVMPDEDLGKRAIAVGIGLDTDENGDIIVCAQILTSSEGQDKPAGTRVVEEKGKVAYTAITKISETTGLTLTASHCNVILVGENLIDSGRTFDVVVSLLENTYFNDNAYIFSCDGTPKDIFSSSSAFGQNASQYLQQLIKMQGTYENIAYKTLRQVICECYNVGRTTYLPNVTKENVTPEIPPSSSFEEMKKEDDFSYSVKTVRILKDGQNLGLYGEDGITALNFLLTKVKNGSNEFDTGKTKIGLIVLSDSLKTNYDLQKKTFFADLKISVSVKEKTNSSPKPFPLTLTDDEKAFCEKIIKEKIETFYEEMREKDADVFAVKQHFYSKYGNISNELLFRDVDFTVNVKVSVEK